VFDSQGDIVTITVQAPPVSASEARVLLDASSDRTSTGLRNRALIALLWRAGVRPGEALALAVDGINLTDGTLTIGDRVAGLDSVADGEIRAWLARRDDLGLPASGPFISTLRGKPLSQAYVRELLPRLAERAGLDTRVHAMGLRYACAAEMAGEGIATEVIETQLGIRPQSSVARYLPQPDTAEVVSAMRGRPAA
jgi:integrase/recombinase XerD